MSKSIAQMIQEQSSPEWKAFVAQCKKEEAEFQAAEKAKRDSMIQSITSDGYMTQIKLTLPENPACVILTQFKGEKMWSVVGHDSRFLHDSVHKCYNGMKSQFQRKNAFMMAYEYLTRGCTQF